jgi:hypothetical protein
MLVGTTIAQTAAATGGPVAGREDAGTPGNGEEDGSGDAEG